MVNDKTGIDGDVPIRLLPNATAGSVLTALPAERMPRDGEGQHCKAVLSFVSPIPRGLTDPVLLSWTHRKDEAFFAALRYSASCCAR